MDTGITTEAEMNAIAVVLKISKKVKVDYKGRMRKVNLQTEAVWSALKAMKDDPTITIPQAMSYGLGEWEK